MIKRTFLNAFFALGITSFLLVSCEKDPAEYCEEYPVCSLSPTICCDDSNNCTYKYNGNEYATEDELLAAVCGSAMTAPQLELIKMELDAFSIQLIEKAKQKAICD